jgi:hypothetical protein
LTSSAVPSITTPESRSQFAGSGCEGSSRRSITHILTFHQAGEAAKQLARGTTDASDSKPMTVADAIAAYKRDLKSRGGQQSNATRVEKHLTSSLAGKPVGLLTVRLRGLYPRPFGRALAAGPPRHGRTSGGRQHGALAAFCPRVDSREARSRQPPGLRCLSLHRQAKGLTCRR